MFETRVLNVYTRIIKYFLQIYLAEAMQNAFILVA